jgi:hypothetical protein
MNGNSITFLVVLLNTDYDTLDCISSLAVAAIIAYLVARRCPTRTDVLFITVDARVLSRRKVCGTHFTPAIIHS